MKISAVLQHARGDQHIQELEQALVHGGHGCAFRALVAFARYGSLTSRLFHAMDEFCRRGGVVDWIIGTDLGGTDARSLTALKRLGDRHPGCRARLLVLPGRAVVHPKLYWLSTPDQQLAFIGSANCTAGGFRENLELSVRLEADRASSHFNVIRSLLDDIWRDVEMYQRPTRPGLLTSIDDEAIRKVGHFYQLANQRPVLPPHPLRPHTARVPSARPQGPPKRTLLMELTLEQGRGRMKQVQPPKNIWIHYFRVRLSNPGWLHIRWLKSGHRYIKRPVVLHHHNWTIEVSGADRSRPALLRVVRTDHRRFRYEIIDQADRRFASLIAMLRSTPNPLRESGRLWLMW